MSSATTAKRSKGQSDNGESHVEQVAQNDERADLIALLRLLIREPPADHDFHTCPICKRYGITRI